MGEAVAKQFTLVRSINPHCLRRAGSAGDSLEKLREICHLCNSLGVRVRPVKFCLPNARDVLPPGTDLSCYSMLYCFNHDTPDFLEWTCKAQANPKVGAAAVLLCIVLGSRSRARLVPARAATGSIKGSSGASILGLWRRDSEFLWPEFLEQTLCSHGGCVQGNRWSVGWTFGCSSGHNCW